ncbi:uncharacterized protein P174DRAFT_235308 [Aspergillus novofumigatus IBT 16806]|uniref:Uncharacterized protein n=1 Tax=Aspergillus novofumigatus (strain IBT 16806) TaxID=1392255 RepID=A0A2I1C7C0_ASPN1|nr:uncharacterized protein P174DRAFT_235308 [Aspergillus novofumigatus IBT 16806]PKX93486.1 hypothetical protein P174DRAFT_235308 [Aspergillus novofumigatus IBT 16806]
MVSESHMPARRVHHQETSEVHVHLSCLKQQLQHCRIPLLCRLQRRWMIITLFTAVVFKCKRSIHKESISLMREAWREPLLCALGLCTARTPGLFSRRRPLPASSV